MDLISHIMEHISLFAKGDSCVFFEILAYTNVEHLPSIWVISLQLNLKEVFLLERHGLQDAAKTRPLILANL